MRTTLTGILAFGILAGSPNVAEAKSCIAIQMKAKYACGLVEEDFGGGAIKGATVQVYESLATYTAGVDPVATAISDAEGRFAIPQLRPGNYYVVAQFPPYDTIHFYLAIRKKIKQAKCQTKLRILMNVSCGRLIEVRG